MKPQTKQNVLLEKRVPIHSGHYFTIDKGFAYVCSRYGSNNHIDIIDVRKPGDAKLVHTIHVQNAVSHIAVQGGMLYASERYRALHIYDIAKPEAPVLKDVVPLYGDVSSGFAVLKDYAVVAFDYGDQVGLINLKKTFQIQPVHTIKVKDCDDGIVQCNGRLFMCDGENTLLELELAENKLAIVNKISINKFKSKKSFLANDRIYLYGDGKKVNLLVLDMKKPEKVIAQYKIKIDPVCILPLENKNAVIFHQNYTCSLLDAKTGKTNELFKFYQEGEGGRYLEVPVIGGKEKFPEGIENYRYLQDATRAIRSGQYLYTVNNMEFLIWKIQKGSLFEKIIDSGTKSVKKKTAALKKSATRKKKTTKR
jgi:hypothetical protein